MQRQNKKAFLLIDSLISVFVTCILCVTCFAIYNSIFKYEQGYIEYQSKSNENLEYIYNNLYECEACVLDEPD